MEWLLVRKGVWEEFMGGVRGMGETHGESTYPLRIVM